MERVVFSQTAQPQSLTDGFKQAGSHSKVALIAAVACSVLALVQIQRSIKEKQIGKQHLPVLGKMA